MQWLGAGSSLDGSIHLALESWAGDRGWDIVSLFPHLGKGDFTLVPVVVADL